jgi:myosin-3
MVYKPYSQYSQIIKFDELQSPDNYWELLESIGEGTYGEVFKARNLQTGNYAAVKVMESINEVIEEIEEEYMILKDLSNHPNLPKFFGIFLKKSIEEDQLWLVLELCSNGSVTDLVKSLIKCGQKLDENVIAHILRQTVLALEHLHKNYVMHRDVKGHNILITENGAVKLVDFGVSAHLKSSVGRRNTSVGTPFWMAPEVIACEQQMEYDYDVRCDIWSLGITAIELADGEPPLSELHPMRALFKIPRNPSPTVRNPKDWSPEYNDFIRKCLVKDFERRPTVDELLKHPFLTRVADSGPQLKEKLKNVVQEQRKYMFELNNMPEVTTKHGKFKSKRKSRRHSPYTVDDLASLENFDEDSIVTQLFNRFMQGQIYTYIGDILLAVNPFTNLGIYNEEWSKKYQNSLKNENPPHIFATADFTYQAMMHNHTNQCIIISGESGSGKTESANLLLQQLTVLGRVCIFKKSI